LVVVGQFTREEIADNAEFASADGVIELSRDSREPAVDLRSLRVSKMRGRRHLEGKHTFRITSTGIETFPRIEALDPGPLGDDPGGSLWRQFDRHRPAPLLTSRGCRTQHERDL